MSDRTRHYRFRDALADRLEHDLLGPAGGPDEVVDDPPVTGYVTGILFPSRKDDETRLVDAAEQDLDLTAAVLAVDEAPDTGVSMANRQAPSSMGITFAVDTGTTHLLHVATAAAVYEPVDEAGTVTGARRARRRTTHEAGVRWRRRPLTLPGVPIDLERPGGPYSLTEGLELRVRVRTPDPAGVVSVTVTLVNTNEVVESELQDPHCFFQPELVVSAADGSSPFVERRAQSSGADDEVLVTRLLYRHAPTFAVGHGCAAVWDWTAPPPSAAVTHASVASVRTAFVPRYDVCSTDSNPDIDVVDLDMTALAEASGPELSAALHRLLDGYALWVDERALEAESFAGTEFADIAVEQIVRCREALTRMRSGVALVERRPEVREAFQLANLAMAEQRGRTDWIRAGRVGRPQAAGQWRPFQIAFMLLCLDGIVDPDHEDRRIADLLWFPTGGGKTEAYLGLIAFTTFLRRIRDGEAGHGVTVLMRYTLRLLTLQQFERAAALICAMEVIRRGDPDRLGRAEISIGMWVGKAATPNRLEVARKSLQKLRRREEVQEENPVQLRQCPSCGTPLDAFAYHVDEAAARMDILCPDSACAFRSGLPVHVVDETVYAAHPTLVIATVDKFAQIAWRGQVANLFNRDLAPGVRAPELVIQDELHLISGPLGTMAGLYETAVDIAADLPKVIASTATIRRAREQGLRLFDREVRQFPPSGLDARDSWFALERPHEVKSARLYVGLLTPSTSQATLLVRAYSALLHHTASLDGEDEIRDPYWTLVGYFNSLRLLAAAELQVVDDVQDRLKLLASRAGVTRRDVAPPSELTSRVASSEIPARLGSLETALPGPALDTVLATNMISVGVDVDRLGLMAVTGQPQTTAEYIQATSRVGRRHPGLVVTLFNGARSRDRSHYESFHAYHSALYRQVEATGVTPFSARARDRALHAVLVGLVRLRVPAARANTGAAFIEQYLEQVRDICDDIVNRVKAVAPEEAGHTARDLAEIVEDWRTAAVENGRLVYEAPPRFRRGERRAPETALLRSHSDDDLEYAWDTLWSLRDVDVESDLYLED
ncbi:DNA helicase [Yinghuangia seranimata]|uniref:DNA helicase n=1 Tax=Yinghuangia seranimata TaxID=408067 RepID=UPI00248B5EFF|nr:DNA helicase [Yinghuangia seranimata]MDI2130869.1 DNA helicase [Yinghuangia seranimata]